MIQERATQVRVGIFVSTGFLLAMFVIFMIGSERAWFERTYKLYCTFDDVSGLGTGAAVSLAGLRVGSVSAVVFPEDLSKKEVIIELEVSTKFQDRIRADSKASVATQGLLGDKMVQVTVGTPAAEALGDGDALLTAPAGDLFSIGQSATDLMTQVREVVTKVSTLVDAAKQGEGVLHALLYDPQGAELMRDLGASVRTIRRLTARVDRQAAGEGIGSVLDNLEQASQDLRVVTGQIRRGEGTLGALLTDNAIYNDLRSLFGRANRSVVLKSVIRSMLRERERTVQRP